MSTAPTVPLPKDKESQDEINSLKAELRGMEILLQQNAALEAEVERLNTELDEATSGVQKRGYLYKWREREIYYAAKWGLRYFVLQGNKISYYGNDHENRPRRTIDLSNCYVRDEGKKKGYHIFSVYLGSTTATDADNPLDSSLLLRMSSESSAEAMLWIDMLEQGCVVNDGSFPPLNTPSMSFVHSELSPTLTDTVSTSDSNGTGGAANHKFTFDNIGQDKEHMVDGDWSNSHELRSNDDLSNLAEAAEKSPIQIPMVTLTRVRSSTKVLQKSQSRQTFARRILSSRAPQQLDRSGPPTPITRTASGSRGAPKRTTGKGIHKSFPAFKPMHVQAQTSPLSPDISKADHNFRGFFNLGVIILLISHAEMIINNLMKYGFKASLPLLLWTSANIAEVRDSSFTLEYLSLALCTWAGAIISTFLVEKAAATGQVPEKVILGVNYVLGTINIVLPCVLVWRCDAHPGANMLYLMESVIIWMKLISYAHANRGLRRSSRKIKKADRDDSAANRDASGNASSSASSSSSASTGKGSTTTAPAGLGSRQSSGDDLYSDNNAKPYGDQISLLLAECKDLQPPFLLYPQNITLSNLLYFMVAPTLCYQLNYPRIPKIRWSKVFFLVFRMIFVAAITIFAVEQYMVPTLETSLAPMEERDVLMIIERLLKLSIPNTYVWLLGFYFFFHLWLNLLAELTRFGDRLFYKEWWNARTIDEYW